MQESDEFLNEKSNNDFENNTTSSNNKENKEINIESQKDSNNQEKITILEVGKNSNLTQTKPTDFENKIEDEIDKINNNEHSCENNNIKNEGEINICSLN